MKFLVNLCFVDLTNLMGLYLGGGGLIFEMLVGLHIWGVYSGGGDGWVLI